MHCFSSSKALAIKSIELGFYLSMSGIAAFPKSTELREIFSMVPLDKILVETDSPYPLPHLEAKEMARLLFTLHELPQTYLKLVMKTSLYRPVTFTIHKILLMASPNG